MKEFIIVTLTFIVNIASLVFFVRFSFFEENISKSIFWATILIVTTINLRFDTMEK